MEEGVLTSVKALSAEEHKKLDEDVFEREPKLAENIISGELYDEPNFDHLFMCSSRPITFICDIFC